MTSQIIEGPRSRGIIIGGPSRRGDISRDRPRRIPTWITENQPESTVRTNTIATPRPRDLGKTLVHFGERLRKTTEQRKATLTGDTSVGRTNQVRGQNNEFRTGFPEKIWNRNGAKGGKLPTNDANSAGERGEVQSSGMRTPNPRFVVQSNRDRIRQLQAEKRRIMMENARTKYQNNAYLNTRGLISGKRLPTESRFVSNDLSLSNQNQRLTSPVFRTSNQNRLSAFARRNSLRRVSLTGSSFPEQQDARPRMLTDRQTARDQLKQVSVSRSKGANSYLKRLLYKILRRIKKN